MDFIRELYALSERITDADFKDKVKAEQGTIYSFVNPFIGVLGYDFTNPTDVRPEFPAGFGTKPNEKVDLAICKDEKVIMLIECKHWSSDLPIEDYAQLSRYFTAVKEARIGVLTNGVLYRFYTDSENPNLMDPKPFFEFDMSEIQRPLVDVLKNFTKDNFDLDKARFTAIDLKYRSEIKEILIEQRETPTDDFVEFFYNAIEPEMEKQVFRDVIKHAYNEFLDGRREEKTNGSNVTTGQTTHLKVTMPNEDVIRCYHGKDTYIKVLENLGLEAVRRVCPDIVSTEPVPKGVEREGFWIRGANGLSTIDKKRKLEEVARLLDVPLIVQVVKKLKSE